MKGTSAAVEVRYKLTTLKAPGAYVATVSGWGPDSMSGPLFRLVSTVIVPAPLNPGTNDLPAGVQVEPGTQLPSFFVANSGRPFEVRVSSSRPGQKGLAFLHDPGGMPYRAESARPIGTAEGQAVYTVDGRDAQLGVYEVVAV